MPYPYYQTPYQPMGYGYNNYAPVSAQNAAGAQHGTGVSAGCAGSEH